MEKTMKQNLIRFLAVFAFLLLMLACGLALSVKADTVPEGTVSDETVPDDPDPEEPIPDGLNYDDEGKMHYYKNGEIDKTYNGFATFEDEFEVHWYFVENGDVTFERNDVVKGTIRGEEGWYYVLGSEFIPVTTVAKNKDGWWYCKDGKVDFTYWGFGSYLDENDKEHWLYCEDGQVTFKRNDIIKGKLDGVNGWWYVVNSEFTPSTTVAKNSIGWWYVEDGMVDFSYTGFARNEYGWWYCEKGQVTFQKNDILQGIANNAAGKDGEDGWWYVRNSKVTDTETVANNAYGWWYVNGGKVDFSHNGVEGNDFGWWYIHKGKVDFTYNGFEKNKYGWWYCEKGQVTFKKNDIIKGVANSDPKKDGEDGWWYVKSSKVTDTETVSNNAYGWWYVNHGKVDFNYTGIKNNQYGWWRIVKGKVDFSCNSVEQNEYGWWYIRDGKVDFSYTGLGYNSYGWWYCEKGKVNFEYTGPAIYNKTGYHIINGKLDFKYSGTVYGDTTYTVKSGMIISSWISYRGALYFCRGTGIIATETVTIDGRDEVFRMDGRWINTTAMDTKASSYYYSTTSDYLILVNCADRVTKVYKKSSGGWAILKNYLCTVGDDSKGWGTVKGDFYIGKSSTGNPVTRGYSFDDGEGHTLYYWTRFCDSYLFHSMLYDQDTYDLSKENNDLGEAESHGCVRLRFENAKWIYNNIPDGTRVIVY